ncbi:MAG: Gfo/Idh/MocA family oxidoreductase [Chloroflexota bacterium]
MDTVRWGIIGCGDVTEVKSGPGFQKATNSRLVAVMRRTGHLAKDYAERHGVPRWYDDADALINDPEVDAVCIATPPNSHKEYTLAVAAAGKPVYVEKPMALNYSECQEMVAACSAADVPLFVAYYRRCLPRFVKIRALIEEGAIGKIRAVSTTLFMPPNPNNNDDQVSWRVVPEIAGAGLFYDLSAHTFDFLDYVLGPIDAARGYTRNQAGLYEAEDIVSASFSFQSGAQGSGTWCFSSYYNHDQTDIVGTKGHISFATFAEQPVILTTSVGTTPFEIAHPGHVQQPLIQTIVDDLLGKGKCPSTGESGARTNWVMDQILGK